MKIILITPGTGSYYCGVCMRDNALATELIRQGHDAMMVPLYLPLQLDETSASPNAPTFFGGINVYLQEKFPIFRHTPRWLDWLFDLPGLLRFAGGGNCDFFRSARAYRLPHTHRRADEQAKGNSRDSGQCRTMFARELS